MRTVLPRMVAVGKTTPEAGASIGRWDNTSAFRAIRSLDWERACESSDFGQPLPPSLKHWLPVWFIRQPPWEAVALRRARDACLLREATARAQRAVGDLERLYWPRRVPSRSLIHGSGLGDNAAVITTCGSFDDGCRELVTGLAIPGQAGSRSRS